MPPDPQNPDPEAARIKSLDDRFGAIEAEQASQRGLLEQIRDSLGGTERTAHAAAQKHEEQKLDQPSDVADEVRRQFAERDRQQASQQAAAAADDWRKGVDASLAELKEKPPEVPVRRVEKLLGWR
jgi:hypothetical protein